MATTNIREITRQLDNATDPPSSLHWLASPPEAPLAGGHKPTEPSQGLEHRSDYSWPIKRGGRSPARRVSTQRVSGSSGPTRGWGRCHRSKRSVL